MTAQVLADILPQVLSQADNLPSLPAVAVEVLRLTRSDDTTIAELADVISRDPALSAKLLKLSNSAMFNSGNAQVKSMNQAAMMLGLKTVKLMSLSFSLASSLPKSKGGEGYDFDLFWERSLCSAVAGRSFGRLVESRVADEAFTCGLFSRLGQIVLYQCLKTDYLPVIDAAGGGLPTTAREREMLGFDNTAIGQALLAEWGLPIEIHASVLATEDVEEALRVGGSEFEEIARLVRIAELAARVICDDEKGSAMEELTETAARDYDLSEAQVANFLVGLEAGIRETAETMSVELPGQGDYSEIVDQARSQIVAISLDATMNLQAAERRAHSLAAENEQLVSRANTDKLTGLGNRAYFDGVLAEQVQERIDGDVPLALGLLMVDVDHFKKFNDTYGHQTGDRVLEVMGKCLAEYTRDSDVPVRYGGEEFAVVAPQTTLDGLRVLAERLRYRVAQQVIEADGERLSVTVSIGGACITDFEQAADGAALIKVADESLYRAKSLGRNRCEFHPESRLHS